MSVLTIVFWTVVIWAIVALVRYLGTPARSESPSSPEDILAGRFARGEINDVDYNSRLRTLRSSSTASSSSENPLGNALGTDSVKADRP